jgi:hypothetical protein
MKLLLLALAAIPLSLGAGQDKVPYDAERICGRLVHNRIVPEKDGRSFTEQTKAFPTVSVRLYFADGSIKCCEQLRLVSETKTSNSGHFEFKDKKLSPGLYWVVFRSGDHDYEFLVRYAPSKALQTKCSDVNYQVRDDGTTGIGIKVIID